MRPAPLVLMMLTGLTLVGAGAGAAAAVDAARDITARQAGMKAIGRSFKAINDQSRAGTPDAAVVRAEAAQLATLAARVPGWFPRGTGPGDAAKAKVKTAAKAEIWSQSDDFRAKASALSAASATLAAAAKGSGDVAALQPQIRAVGGTCKACHTSYKVQS